MNSNKKMQTSDVVVGAYASWHIHLEQICLFDVTPFSVIDPTARTGP